MMKNIGEIYQQQLKNGTLQPNMQQEQFVKVLCDITHALQKHISANWLQKFTMKASLNPKGLYVYGGVGRGKTYLLSLFLQQFDKSIVRKQHFRQFMQAMHKLLAIKRKQNKVKDILTDVIADISKGYKIFFIDELFIKNVADAMLVSRIFKLLIQNNVFVIFSSNRAPNQLYLNGLQRTRFLPFIEMIESKYKVYNLDHSNDFRRVNIQELKNKVFVGNIAEQIDFLNQIKQNLGVTSMNEKIINIDQNRKVIIPKAFDKIAHFTFEEMCGQPKSATDYFHICQNFDVIILSEITKLNDGVLSKVLRLINFVDHAADIGVKLIVTSNKPMEKIYVGQKYAFEFRRTISRLSA